MQNIGRITHFQEESRLGKILTGIGTIDIREGLRAEIKSEADKVSALHNFGIQNIFFEGLCRSFCS